MRRFFIFFILVISVACAASQSIDNSIHANQFPGSTVGAKVSAAMSTCPAGSTVPCVLIIDPSLAAWAPGQLPTMCANCFLLDFRQGPLQLLSSLNVRGEGATGNGTTDDTAAIERADAQVASTCGTVYFPPAKTYLISSITIPSCVTWDVEGNILLTSSVLYSGVVSQIVVSAGASVISRNFSQIEAANTTNAQAMLYLAGNNIVQGLTINGNAANNTSPQNAFNGSLYVAGDQVQVTNNHFINHNFAITGAPSFLQVRENYFSTSGGSSAEAIHLGQFANGTPGWGGTHIEITSNHFASSAIVTSFTIDLSQISDATITSNQIVLNGTGTTNCMALRDLNNSTISANYCSGSTAEGINLFIQDQGGATLSNNTVTGNVVVDSGTIAFGLIDNTSGGAAISGNVISANTIEDADYSGSIPSDYDTGVRITGTGAVSNNISNNNCSSTLTNQTPSRRGWNACVSFDNISVNASNISIGNQFEAADTSGTAIENFRNLSAANSNSVSFSSSGSNFGVLNVSAQSYQNPGSVTFTAEAALSSGGSYSAPKGTTGITTTPNYGSVTFTTGTTPAIGDAVQISWTNAFPHEAECIFQGESAGTSFNNFIQDVGILSQNSVMIYATAAMTANTSYTVNYLCF